MTIHFEPEEIGYLQGLVKDHLEYYRLLAGNGKCTQKHKDHHRFLETLAAKLMERLL